MCQSKLHFLSSMVSEIVVLTVHGKQRIQSGAISPTELWSKELKMDQVA